MSTYDLSIIIPARNEMFLGLTVENLLKNIRGNTEIIVILDGYDTKIPEIPKAPNITLIGHTTSVGQRATCNEAARLSQAKYLMKVDAHCSFDEGIDVKMIKEMHDDWTMIPIMYNLHAFDWVCQKCGHRLYQGPTPPKCEKCGGEMKREILWKEKRNPESTAYRFDNTLHFQYWGAYKKRAEYKKQLKETGVTETMSIQGSCFMCTRDKWFELDICDEKHGSWGQQGTEVSCKTWLSGGKVKVNHKTWYAHMFRTQGGDFGFPYPNPGIMSARRYSRDLFINGKWDKAKYPLSWLIDRFKPVPDWDVTKGIVYYTDNELDEGIMKMCQKQLKESVNGSKIICVSLKKTPFGDHIIMNLERGYLTMFKQILKGLKTLDTDIVFLCEHDVLYHKSHFDFVPPKKDTFYYNENVWFLRWSDGHALHYDAKQLSGLCAYRDILIKHFEERVALVEKEGFSRRMGFEPMTHGRIKWQNMYKCEGFKSEFPNIDIKHGGNLIRARWKKKEFRNQKFTKGWTESDVIPGWGKAKELIRGNI
ncbi:MAG: glycosyltransferase [Candidatus Pacearchaeota archaeon]|jgi:glycosyltransferase involved in cell wall biosynthesis